MLNQLLGNDHIKSVLRRMISHGRVPRSLLFVGPEGVGKKKFALELAKSFACQAPRDGEACDACAACRRAEIYSFPKADAKVEEFGRVFFSEHLDIGMVVPCRANIVVGSIRDLEKHANSRPYEASARFFIIDDAHKMNDSSSNALLKTLEEPSSTSHIFLVTSRPDALLQTIRSRCQTLRFAPLEHALIERKLLETQKFAPSDAELVARLSGGSIGRALDFDVERFRARRDAMLAVLEGIRGRVDYVALLRIGEEINDAKNKNDFELYLDSLQTLVRDVWALSCGAPAATGIVNVDIGHRLEGFAGEFGAKRLASWLVEIEQLRAELSVNVNKKVATDALLVKMASA